VAPTMTKVAVPCITSPDSIPSHDGQPQRLPLPFFFSLTTIGPPNYAFPSFSIQHPLLCCISNFHCFVGQQLFNPQPTAVHISTIPPAPEPRPPRYESTRRYSNPLDGNTAVLSRRSPGFFLLRNVSMSHRGTRHSRLHSIFLVLDSLTRHSCAPRHRKYEISARRAETLQYHGGAGYYPLCPVRYPVPRSRRLV
jgi:hypothetical protein